MTRPLQHLPARAVEREQGEEEEASGEAVRVEESEQASPVHALVVDGYAFEYVGKGDAEKKAREEASDKDTCAAQAPPGRSLALVREFYRHCPDDEREENDHERV